MYCLKPILQTWLFPMSKFHVSLDITKEKKKYKIFLRNVKTHRDMISPKYPLTIKL